jgi:phospholipase C
MLRFVETRFGARVPNLSSWRRKHTGDLTSTFNFAARPRYRAPGLPNLNGLGTGTCFGPAPVSVTAQGVPHQEHGTRKRPSGIVKPKPKPKPKKHKHH